MKKHIFISHCSKDDEFVKALRKSLEIQELPTWDDSRCMRSGDDLEPGLKEAIEQARAFILVLTKDTFNSAWVLKETKYARQMRKEKGKEKYPLIPLMLEGIEPAALNLYFEQEKVGIKIKVGAGGVNEAMPQILVALGLREPEDIQPMLNPETEPLEELLIELTDLKITTRKGKRRAGATAQITYLPAEKGKREVQSDSRFQFSAPLGPIEKEELSWYLERYYSWPVGVFRERAQQVEKQLPLWGKQLYEAVFVNQSVLNVLAAWETSESKAARRFTIFVDSRPIIERGTKKKSKKQLQAEEAAALLLGLPWELLHNGKEYLFQAVRAVQVRRRLPNKHHLEGMVSEPPIRILLVSPRPEDDSAGYIDHRASALPLVTALERLGAAAELTFLAPPTFPAFKAELERARHTGVPYHVVHFDGHGVFSKEAGLGALCFENPEDEEKLEKRRSQAINAPELGELVRKFRIPLIFLEACQTAQAEETPTASVAAALLEKGAASVVAMSHSVLVVTACRFVQAFYEQLAAGTRVGKAMLAGQQALQEDPFRLKIFGAGRLELQDWFVPVLYQEKEDLQLLTRIPSRPIEEIDRQALENRLGALLPTPAHKFVGRSRELLKLERLLHRKSYAVVCGQGGEGKTTLAVELARWMVRSNRFYRAVFVSLEKIYDLRTVVDQVGGQLLPKYSVAEYDDPDPLGKAMQPIERQLREDRTIIIFDNMESILPTGAENGAHEKFLEVSKPFFKKRTASAAYEGPGGHISDHDEQQNISHFEPEVLAAFFVLCEKLLKKGDTRLVFTSREALPEPFAAAPQVITLSRLFRDDAIDLVHGAMKAAGFTPKEDDKIKAQPEVEALVEAVNCHARSLALLAPYINEMGVERTTENIGRIMAALQEKYPDERERSLFASLELSLRRLHPGIREKIKPLGVFHGGAHIYPLRQVLELSKKDRDLLAVDLLKTGLVESMPYGFLRFHPALCPYLRREMDEETLAGSTARWAESMKQLSDLLYWQQSEDTQLSATLTLLELPNLMRLLEYVRGQGDAEATVNLAARLEQLIARLGRPRLLARIAAIRAEESKNLPDWSNTRFKSYRMQIERLLAGGNFPAALQEAQSLLDKSLSAGEEPYPEAAYNTAVAYVLFGRVLKKVGAAQAALEPIEEAYRRFQGLADRGNKDAARMVSAALAEKGDCLFFLGRLEEAAAAYEEGIQIDEKRKSFRDVAVGKGQLGTVRKNQKRYDNALKAYDEALKIFENLGEPASVATIHHQVGMTQQEAGRFEAAEHAYRQALSIRVQHNLKAEEGATLNQLGNLYDKMNRLEEAIVFYQQAADKSVEIGDRAKEGLRRNNLADTLIKLKRYDEARREILRAIECDKPYGHAAEPWTAWAIKCNLEKAQGNREAAEEARRQAIQLYLDYRRDGGENHNPGGRLCLAFLQAMQQDKKDEMAATLEKLASAPGTPPLFKKLVEKLQAMLGGSRDPGLAEDPELDYDDAAEIKYLLEKLGAL